MRPLDVPWQISPSTPALGLGTKCVDAINHGYVTFLGWLGEDTTMHAQYGDYTQIAVVLKRILYAKLCPEYSVEDHRRLDTYDWGAIPEFRDKDGSLREHTRRFHDAWNASNRCPDPSAYIVEDSDTIECLGFNDDSFKHYIFIGDDFNIEVVAETFAWEVVDPNSTRTLGESSGE